MGQTAAHRSQHRTTSFAPLKETVAQALVPFKHDFLPPRNLQGAPANL